VLRDVAGAGRATRRTSAAGAQQTIARTAVPSADDGASPWAVIGLALGCAALLGGAGLALARRARRAGRTVG
jgi:hypothetical protein